MTIHGAGFSARSGAGDNDKTTAAGLVFFWQCAIFRQCFPPGSVLNSTQHGDFECLGFPKIQ